MHSIYVLTVILLGGALIAGLPTSTASSTSAVDTSNSTTSGGGSDGSGIGGGGSPSRTESTSPLSLSSSLSPSSPSSSPLSSSSSSSSPPTVPSTPPPAFLSPSLSPSSSPLSSSSSSPLSSSSSSPLSSSSSSPLSSSSSSPLSSSSSSPLSSSSSSSSPPTVPSTPLTAPSTPPTAPSTSPTAPTTPPNTDPTTQPTFPLELALGVAVGVAGFLLLSLLLLLLVCCCCCCMKKDKKLSRTDLNCSDNHLLNSYHLEESGKKPQVMAEIIDLKALFAHIPDFGSIPLEEFQAFVSSLHENDDEGAEDEYEYVRAMDSPVSKINASLPCNEARNRYINIMSDDETRVVLSAVSKVPGSDYINANYIKGYNSPREYIATQGPLPNTAVDFWRMVWEQNVHIIVMVTNLLEGGVIKCHHYWPKQGSVQYGGVVVILEKEKQFPEFVVRSFSVSSARKKSTETAEQARTVIQFHFAVWPDFGVPSDASSMLKFVRRVRSHVHSDHGPMVVHCSAGVGRTGTFIAIDVMLQKLAVGEALNIQEFVFQMRAQRNHMVQTNGQYLFIYDAVLHALDLGNTELGVAQLREHLAALSLAAEEDGEGMALEKEFKQVMSLPKPCAREFSVALEEYNAAKNRDTNNLPLNNNLVALQNTDSSPGADYINASFVKGYYLHPKFIVTQHPLDNTRENFWEMVLQRNVATIVTIGPLSDTQDNYWPREGTRKMECGGVMVELVTSKELGEGVTVRELQVECAEMEIALPVCQYHLWEWPKEGAPPTPGGMLALVQNSRQHWRESGCGHIVIHSSNSLLAEASGVYCAVCILQHQMEVEGCVDVVTTARHLREQRPGILTSQHYYKFIYEVLAYTQKQ